MPKILIVPDIHYCKNSSLIQSRGTKFSTRIENCISSINWVEETALKENCATIIYLGDFFDADNLDSEVLSSLQDLKFNSLKHYCITGNHEISVTNNEYSSVKLLQNFNNIDVIYKPTTLEINNVYLHMLPYIYDIEDDITKYFDFSDKTKKHILLSHNDIKGIYYGRFLSTIGLDYEKLTANCNLVINGHIHNNSWVNEKILNLGLLTGQNFNEDAFTYEHNVAILDLDKNNLELIENPFAFNFYKIEIKNIKDYKKFDTLKNNAVVSIKCNESLIPEVKEIIKNSSRIVASRLIISKNILSQEEIEKELKTDLSVNHLEKLKEFCLNKIENTDILIQELQEICR